MASLTRPRLASHVHQPQPARLQPHLGPHPARRLLRAGGGPQHPLHVPDAQVPARAGAAHGAGVVVVVGRPGRAPPADQGAKGGAVAARLRKRPHPRPRRRPARHPVRQHVPPAGRLQALRLRHQAQARVCHPQPPHPDHPQARQHGAVSRHRARQLPPQPAVKA